MSEKQLSNTQVILKDIIKREHDESGYANSENEFFEFFAASQILKDYELSDDEIEYGHCGAGNDGGCDSIYTFLNNSMLSDEQVQDLSAPRDSILEFCIIQSKNTTSFKEDAIMKWKTVCSNLLNLGNSISDYAERYNSNVRDAFQLFRDSYTKLITSRIKLIISFYYVTISDELHPNVQSQADELKELINNMFPNATVKVDFIGANSLFERYNTSAENQMNLKLAEIPISPDQKKNYVALVNLKTFYDFIVDDNGTLRKRLFESNVRDYQGRNNVNNCISDTLRNNDGEDFWWLNNGITILASEAVLVNNKELQITNPEIVNGLQTSTEICNFFSANHQLLETEERSVLVRIIVPESEEVRDNVIFATNNQTNIPKATLRVTDPIHLKIEMYLKSRGLYYDRRKNYYKNQGKKPYEIVTVSFLAQCLISLLLKRPDHARARPSTLLNDDDTYEQLYNDSQNLDMYLIAAKLGKKIKKNVKATTYNQTEKSDILFYVLFAIASKTLNKSSISVQDLIGINVERISDEFISRMIELVYSKYVELGGNSRVAKDPNFINQIEPLLEIGD